MKFLAPLLLPLFVFSASADANRWIDTSYDTFLTRELKNSVRHFGDFPLFWWNHIVLEPKGGPQKTEDTARQICSAISASRVVAQLPCHPNLQSISQIAESWIADTPLRKDFSARAFDLQWQSALAKAALPLPREILEWLRRDPLNELEEYHQLQVSRVPSTLTLKNGSFADRETGRILLPVQFTFPPSETDKTRHVQRLLNELCERTDCGGARLIGPHFGTLENEQQIRSDLDVVSYAGTILILVIVGFLLYTRRTPLLWLFPPLAMGIGLAVVLTVLFFGQIHAISLSFGPALIGLAFDYGVHAAFLDPKASWTWRSNFMALLTSLVALLLLAFSSVPLFQQMMFFSITGLVLTYALFYVIMRRYPERFRVPALSFIPRPSRPLSVLAVLLVIAAGLFIKTPLRLDLGQMNYQSPITKSLNSWWEDRRGNPNLFTIASESEGSTHLVHAWALAQGIHYDGPARNLPDPAAQSRHKATWSPLCSMDYFHHTELAERFFPPFLNLVCGDRADVPAYLADYFHKGRWLNILFATSETQATAIRQRFPEAQSPRDLIQKFPVTFARELAWMLPLALFAALSFLGFYYRSARQTLLAAIPFFSGAGAVALMSLILGFPVNFVSLMGLLLVFGFSVDYGIFVVDQLRSPTSERDGVWSALAFCAITTIAGFAPLIFAHHPVLNSLGHALLWGSVGTCVGAFWGIPTGYRWLVGRGL